MLRLSYLVLAAFLMLTPALAHTGVGDTTGLAHGFLHPVGGDSVMIFRSRDRTIAYDLLGANPMHISTSPLHPLMGRRAFLHPLVLHSRLCGVGRRRQTKRAAG